MYIHLSISHHTCTCTYMHMLYPVYSLYIGVSAGSIAYLVSGKPFPEFITALQSVAQYPIIWTTGKFLVALPLCYHLVNGIRHLVSAPL